MGGLFSGIEDAKRTKGGNYLKPGLSALEVGALKMIETRKKDDMFIAELVVIKSSNPAHPAGSHISWTANLKHDAAMGDIKNFAAAVLGCEETEITEEVMERLVDEEENPAAGSKVFVDAYNKETQAGGDFTRTDWRPLDEKKDLAIIARGKADEGQDEDEGDEEEEQEEEEAAPPPKKKGKPALPGKGGKKK